MPKTQKEERTLLGAQSGPGSGYLNGMPVGEPWCRSANVRVGAEESLAREVALTSLTDKNMAVGGALQGDPEKGRKRGHY